jgi:NitT/TauT family transport system substrate-binding protein
MRGTISRLTCTLIGGIAAFGFAASAFAAETIKCAYPYWFGFAPVHVATELGFFAEEGIEVTTVFDNDRANVMPALEGGDLDCTMRTIGEHMSRPLRPDSGLLVIGTIDVSVGADGVVAGPEIKSVADLVGKTFAGEINHPGTVMTQYALKQIGKSIKDVNLKLIATDDASAVFEDPSVAAVATWEPMMSDIVENTARKGSHILLSSKDFQGLVTDVIIVRKADYEKRPQAYAAFLRGVYRAVDVYNKEPDKFLAAAAPAFEVTPEAMKADLGGVYYTSYEDAVAYLGTRDKPGKLKDIFGSLNEINVDLDLMDAPLDYGQQVEPGLIQGLFDGKKR